MDSFLFFAFVVHVDITSDAFKEHGYDGQAEIASLKTWI